MAATATARRAAAPARRSAAPARKARRAAAPARTARRRPAPRRRSAASRTPLPARVVPAAVGRTAGAVSDIADSGLVVRLTRGRLWIGALTTLLVGIVALNVMALSLSASESKVGRQVDALARENSALRAKIADGLSNERIQAAAARLGLFMPEASAIRYLKAASDNAAVAARRLLSGELTGTSSAPLVATVTTAPAPTAPTTAAPTSVPPAASATTTSTAEAPAATDEASPPAAPPAPAAAGGGGGSSGGGGVAIP
jgi:hypothetical protein